MVTLAVLNAPGCTRLRDQRALDRAVAYFARDVRDADPTWASLFGYLRRRFGFELVLADGLQPERATKANATALERVYLRLEDPAASVTRRQVADLPTAIDRITATGLHCDRIGLPSDWLDVLRKATRAGGYALTHSVLALQWTLENRCLPKLAAVGLQAEQSERLQALIERRHALAERHDVSVDIWFEAVVMLYYLGDGERVRPDWVADLRALQRPDGGWPIHPDAGHSNPHTTALAIWVLLEQLQPGTPPIAWIPGR